MTEREALKLALGTFKLIAAQDQGCGGNVNEEEAWQSAKTLALSTISIMEEALAQPEQEPVADVNVRPSPHGGRGIASVLSHKLPVGSWLLYKTPPQRQPLTQDEVVEGFCKQPHDVQFVSVFNAGVRFAEAAHGIKE